MEQEQQIITTVNHLWISSQKEPLISGTQFIIALTLDQETIDKHCAPNNYNYHKPTPVALFTCIIEIRNNESKSPEQSVSKIYNPQNSNKVKALTKRNLLARFTSSTSIGTQSQEPSSSEASYTILDSDESKKLICDVLQKFL